MKHDFILIFELADKKQDAREHYEALRQYGCDARTCNGVRGYLGLEFSREAQSIVHAKKSATREVLTAIPDATLFTCD